MPDLLSRATTVIAALGSRPRVLGEIAAASGLPAATTTRLLKRLVELGWADQDGNRGAYRLGPRAYALTVATPYRQRLLADATPAMRRLSAAWPLAGIVLVVLRPWGRHLLWECGAYQGRDGRLRLIVEDLWSGASGRLLVAHLPMRERQRWIEHVGLPSPMIWKGIATRRELLAALAEIRRDGCAEVAQPARGLHALAVDLPDGDGGHAALGAYLPLAAPRQGLERDLRRTVADIISFRSAAPRLGHG